MGAAGIFHQRQQYTSHVRQDDAAFRDRGAPLNLDRVGAIDALGGIFLAPADQRDAGAAGIVDDPNSLATPQSHRGVPPGAALFAAEDLVQSDRCAFERPRLWTAS